MKQAPKKIAVEVKVWTFQPFMNVVPSRSDGDKATRKLATAGCTLRQVLYHLPPPPY